MTEKAGKDFLRRLNHLLGSDDARRSSDALDCTPLVEGKIKGGSVNKLTDAEKKAMDKWCDSKRRRYLYRRIHRVIHPLLYLLRFSESGRTLCGRLRARSVLGYWRK